VLPDFSQIIAAYLNSLQNLLLSVESRAPERRVFSSILQLLFQTSASINPMLNRMDWLFANEYDVVIRLLLLLLLLEDLLWGLVCGGTAAKGRTELWIWAWLLLWGLASGGTAAAVGRTPFWISQGQRLGLSFGFAAHLCFALLCGVLFSEEIFLWW